MKDPREQGKQKEHYPSDVNIEDFYKHYKKRYIGNNRPNEKDPYDISRGKYGEITKDLNEKLMDKAIYESKDIKLPCRLGFVGVRKRKFKYRFDENGNLKSKPPVDWGETWKLWKEDPESRERGKLVHMFNDHSDEYIARFKYLKKHAIFSNKSIYTFRPTRTNKKKLSAVMRDPIKYRHIDYYESFPGEG